MCVLTNQEVLLPCSALFAASAAVAAAAGGDKGGQRTLSGEVMRMCASAAAVAALFSAGQLKLCTRHLGERGAGLKSVVCDCVTV